MKDERSQSLVPRKRERLGEVVGYVDVDVDDDEARDMARRTRNCS